MNVRGRPIRFIATVLGGWVGMRVVLLLPAAAPPVARLIASASPPAATAPARAAAPLLAPPIRPVAAPRLLARAVMTPPQAMPARGPWRPAYSEPAQGLMLAAYTTSSGSARLLRAAWRERTPPGWAAPVTLLPPATRTSRWSGSAWLFARGDGDAGAGLAAGGQLGASQAGARIAYRLDPGARSGLAAAARLSSPLARSAGAEAAVGIDWQPRADVPARLSIERRVAIGDEGRDAWSAYAAGGFYRALPAGLELDGYAQAGVVGARRRDLFADGALRVARPLPLGRERTLRIGAGAWGAAQPGVERLDIGPRLALSLPAGGTTLTAAIDARLRVAGDARPGSGAAFTLSADF